MVAYHTGGKTYLCEYSQRESPYFDRNNYNKQFYSLYLTHSRRRHPQNTPEPRQFPPEFSQPAPLAPRTHPTAPTPPPTAPQFHPAPIHHPHPSTPLGSALAPYFQPRPSTLSKSGKRGRGDAEKGGRGVPLSKVSPAWQIIKKKKINKK